jgi:hypothetical protein
MAFKKIVPPLPQVAVSSPSSVSKSESETLWEPCSRSLAAERATILTGCYKRDEAADPEIFIRAATEMLAQYPEATVRKVTHPASGLPSKLKWLPSIAELKEACEDDIGYVRRNVERAKHWEGLKQLPPPPVSEESKARVAELAEKFRGGRGRGDTQAEAVARAKAHTDGLRAMVAAGRSPLAEAGEPHGQESEEPQASAEPQGNEADRDAAGQANAPRTGFTY